ncbi:MAG: DEAD/DEAH box helicase [Actinomycetes bacterium]
MDTAVNLTAPAASNLEQYTTMIKKVIDPTRPPGENPQPAPGFSELGVPAQFVAALARAGITEPRPIQAAALPDALAGHGILGKATTGSGKTLAFALPVVARLAADGAAARPKTPQALILAPTRELARQIDAALAPLAAAAGLRHITVFGGVPAAPQIKALAAGVHIVVACPGRLYDHMQAGHVNLRSVQIAVVDEADHMADMGFLPQIRRVLSTTPKSCQRLLFSATLDGAVDVLVREYLRTPRTHNTDSESDTPLRIEHRLLLLADEADRTTALFELAATGQSTVMFTRTKRRASRLAKQFGRDGIRAVDLHGDLAQNARVRNLEAFSSGRAQVLVATDVAARGIHVDGVELVVHADPPAEDKAYVHRSGRTARSGAAGTVITVVTQDQLRDVRTMLRKAGATAVIESFSGSSKPGQAPRPAAPRSAAALPGRRVRPRVQAPPPEAARSVEPVLPVTAAIGPPSASPTPRRSQTRRRVARPAGPPAPALAS